MLIDSLDLTYRTEIIDGQEVQWACYTNEIGEYVETPVITDGTAEENKAKMNEAVTSQLLETANRGLNRKANSLAVYEDDVYADGVLIRQDFPKDKIALTPQEKALIPDGAVNPVVGRYIGYRPPYDGPGLSVHDQRVPPDDLLSSLGKTAADFPGGLQNWYGIKKGNNPNSPKFYKFVEGYHEQYGVFDLPDLCQPYWIARVYTEDGTPSAEVDIFFVTTEYRLEAWCDANNYTFPNPRQLDGDIWMYGAVFDSTDGSLITLKSYDCKNSQVIVENDPDEP